MEWLLKRGASPFFFLKTHTPVSLSDPLRLIDCAKDRLRTAWAAAWSLSHHPVWRDMVQPAAQCVMGTPVREFLMEDNTARNKRKKI
jgi:hypothetical protein